MAGGDRVAGTRAPHRGRSVGLGFPCDVDGLIAFALSVQSSRKCQVGSALENLIEEVFLKCSIRYDGTRVTENKSKNEFLLLRDTEYKDLNVPAATCLVMSGRYADMQRPLAAGSRRNRPHWLQAPALVQTEHLERSIRRDEECETVARYSWGVHSSYTTLRRSRNR